MDGMILGRGTPCYLASNAEKQKSLGLHQLTMNQGFYDVLAEWTGLPKLNNKTVCIQQLE